ncbi:MAG: BolA family transcriptional regulator [Nitrospirae bacterium]|nr:BolA family transcriptional regulator [Candidatus Troglogloeales bacterium]
MIQEKIEKKINGSLSPVHLTIVDETWRHVGHTGAVPGKGHFILHVVSHQFEGIALLNRNRLVFDILKDEMGTEIHALTIRAQTPSEWERWSVKE